MGMVVQYVPKVISSEPFVFIISTFQFQATMRSTTGTFDNYIKATVIDTVS